MYIQNRVRGTNQYGSKAQLKDSVICKCGHIVSTAEYKETHGFVERVVIKNCPYCKASLVL